MKDHMTRELEGRYKSALNAALQIGYQCLEKGHSALDAVEAAVIALEDDPLFNAGKGSVFAANGLHEMDASIMDGSSLNAGAISGVVGVKNPIRLARTIMQHSEHVYLAGEGAMQYAREMNLEFVGNDYFYDEFRHQQWLEVRIPKRCNLIIHLAVMKNLAPSAP